MGNEDAGDRELQPPPRNHDETKSTSQRIHDPLPAQLSQAELPNHPNSSEQQAVLTPMTRHSLRTSDCTLSVVLMPTPGTRATDEMNHIDDEQQPNPLDVERQETETSPDARDLDQMSVSKTMLRRSATSQHEVIPLIQPQLTSEQSVPGVEPVVGPSSVLVQRNSNESFRVNSIRVNEQPEAQSPEGLLVLAHPVQEGDSASRGPLVDAKPIDDEDCCTWAKGRRLRLMGAGACLVIALIAGLVVGLSADKVSDSTNNSGANNGTSVVATFLEMLPEFISPKSQAALSNPLSAPSQARSWIESLPIHKMMTMERLKQRYALAVFFYLTGDQFWCNRDGWLTDRDECTWFSSSDDPICIDGVYINLDLKDNCLQNVQLDDIFLLSSLRTLSISADAVATGSFPDFLFRLTSLTSLSLVSIGINGTIPEGLKDLSNLELLDVSNNQLSGNIENVMAMTSLKVFNCSFNRFGGTIPTEIGQLKNLVKWSSSSNSFQSVYATEIGASTELDTFHRRDAVVISGIPSEIGNLSNLRILDFSACTISGTIPSEIGRLVKLETLILFYNQLSGTIPDEVFALTNLKHLDLLFNRLTGSLSTQVDGLVNLRYLDLQFNLFGGPLPAKIGSLSSLRRLSLAYNQFNGTIPAILGNLDQLLYLDLSLNRFVGTIPTEFGMLSELSELNLDYNSLTGTIPTEFGSLWNLTIAIFDNTALVDPVPSELGLLPDLLKLSLYNTAMVGPMPAEVCKNVDAPLVSCDIFVACACCTDSLTSLGCENNATSTSVPVSSPSSGDGGSTASQGNNGTGL